MEEMNHEEASEMNHAVEEEPEGGASSHMCRSSASGDEAPRSNTSMAPNDAATARNMAEASRSRANEHDVFEERG